MEALQLGFGKETPCTLTSRGRYGTLSQDERLDLILGYIARLKARCCDVSVLLPLRMVLLTRCHPFLHSVVRMLYTYNTITDMTQSASECQSDRQNLHMPCTRKAHHTRNNMLLSVP